MRCKYGGSPQCKVHNWILELELLREICLESGLQEDLKWSVPVYTDAGKNIVTVNALKESANIGFFKGVLLKDPAGLLQQQGNLQSDRLIKFRAVNEILAVREHIEAYIQEAIAIERSGKKVLFKKNPEALPQELLDLFKAEPDFEHAFKALSPGRQRGYIIYFAAAKQAQTRLKRIEKYKSQIFAGIGLHDRP